MGGGSCFQPMMAERIDKNSAFRAHQPNAVASLAGSCWVKTLEGEPASRRRVFYFALIDSQTIIKMVRRATSTWPDKDNKAKKGGQAMSCLKTRAKHFICILYHTVQTKRLNSGLAEYLAQHQRLNRRRGQWNLSSCALGDGHSIRCYLDQYVQAYASPKSSRKRYTQHGNGRGG